MISNLFRICLNEGRLLGSNSQHCSIILAKHGGQELGMVSRWNITRVSLYLTNIIQSWKWKYFLELLLIAIRISAILASSQEIRIYGYRRLSKKRAYLSDTLVGSKGMSCTSTRHRDLKTVGGVWATLFHQQTNHPMDCLLTPEHSSLISLVGDIKNKHWFSIFLHRTKLSGIIVIFDLHEHDTTLSYFFCI